ncbi:MAG: hypothetical protein WD768_15185 [Phycisphaeraceae bacterium]
MTRRKIRIVRSSLCALSLGLLLSFAASASAVIMPSAVNGRYVQIINNGPADRLLHVGELEVFATGVAPGPNSHVPGNNVSLNNPNDLARTGAGAAIFSATATGGHGANGAVIDGLEQSGGDTWTRQAVNAQVTVDLGGTFSLGTARLHQRNDGCCQERLSNFTVNVFADGGGSPGALVASRAFAGQAATDSFAQIALNNGVMILPGDAGVIGTEVVGTAKYIQVINNGGVNRLLHIGELEAFAVGVAPGPNGNAGGETSLNNPNDLARSAIGAFIFSASNEGGHGATTAVIDGNEQQGGNTWTKQQTGGGAQITVGLASSAEIGTIRVHQRNDGCCQDRLMDFTVNLFADDGTGSPGSLVNSALFAGQAATNSFGELTFGPSQFTIGANDTLKIEIDPSTGLADMLSVGALGDGTLIIEAGATLQIIALSPITSPRDYQILKFGQVFGAFSNIIAPDFVTFDNLLVNGTISAGIPEPASATLALLAMAGLARRRRRAA